MVDRLSLGPIQVYTGDVTEINEALRQLVERIDALKGLRGRTEIWDRVRVDDPSSDQDALTLGEAGSDYVTLATDQEITGEKTFSGGILADEGANGTTRLGRFPMGEISIYRNATATTITTSATYTRFDKTTTFTSDSYLFDSPQAGRLRYTGTTTKMFHVACTMSIQSAGANDLVEALLIKSGTVNGNNEYATGTQLTKGIVEFRLAGAGNIQSSAIHVMIEMVENDYLELFISNETDADDLTVSYMNLFAMGVSGGND